MSNKALLLGRWPIRYKITFGVVLLLVIVTVLAVAGFHGVYAYRGLARSVSRRATEIPLASELAEHVSDLRITLSLTRRLQEVRSETGEPPMERQFLQEQFRGKLLEVKSALGRYEAQLTALDPADRSLGDIRREREKVQQIRRSLQLIDEMNRSENWMLDDVKVEVLGERLEELHMLTGELPSFLHRRMHDFADEVRMQYRVWIVLTWVSSAAAAVCFSTLIFLSWKWVFQPLRVLIHGSRRVAGGEFDHRISLNTHDEMSMLADAMNAMTDRFQAIRDDLDRQVRERTREVVLSERMASVGFLAAGVAHEINNPLASIAFCAESLDDRIDEILPAPESSGDPTSDGPPHSDTPEEDRPSEEDGELGVLRGYLRMIQDEAFRCKEITERLLDFSRMSEVEKQTTDLRDLVGGVIDMVRHLGRYREKNIEFEEGAAVYASVNVQEMKQVVLNLVTNALDSLDRDGTVSVRLEQSDETVEIVVRDNGCGMTAEVRDHLFEPFFTRRRDGQGTGLGLSITYRIVEDHGGRIHPYSAGPGQGSTFRVTLPVGKHDQQQQERSRAA